MRCKPQVGNALLPLEEQLGKLLSDGFRSTPALPNPQVEAGLRAESDRDKVRHADLSSANSLYLCAAETCSRPTLRCRGVSVPRAPAVQLQSIPAVPSVSR